MKVIDLLNKIANDEDVPKKIKYNGFCFEFTGLNYYCEEADMFLEKTICIEDLNYPVEIIEEDKEIEELDLEWFKQVDMFEPKNVELAIEMLAKQLNILSKAVNEIKKGK